MTVSLLGGRLLLGFTGSFLGVIWSQLGIKQRLSCVHLASRTRLLYRLR